MDSPVAEEAGFTQDGAALAVARSGPAVEPVTPQLVDAPTAEIRVVEPAAVAGRVPRAVDPGMLVHVQVYNHAQQKVFSLWNSAEPGGLLASALDELGDAGWLRGGSEHAEASVALAGALLVAVASLEAVQMHHPTVSIDGVEGLLRALLRGEPVPAEQSFKHMRGAGELVDHPDA